LIRRIEVAVARLASDRARLERGGLAEDAPRLWSTGVVRALWASLPEPARKEFGAGVVVRVAVADAGVEIGVTLSGERLDPPQGGAPTEDASAGVAWGGAATLRREGALGAGASSVVGGHLSRTGRRHADLDREVYELYRLSPGHIATIERTTAKIHPSLGFKNHEQYPTKNK
jgi:hypothetical protein